MGQYFDLVKDYALRCDLDLVSENPKEEILVLCNEDKGIYNLVVDCEFPILVMEQIIYPIKNADIHHYKRLLQMNRSLVHGAFVLDEEEKQVLFRDTLQLENLDFNEFEGTINALTLGLAEFSGELLSLNGN